VYEIDPLAPTTLWLGRRRTPMKSSKSNTKISLATIFFEAFPVATCQPKFTTCSKRYKHSIFRLNVVDKTMMRYPINYVIESDITHYFDTVSRDWMMKFLQVRIKDSSLLLLIRRFLKAGYQYYGRESQHRDAGDSHICNCFSEIILLSFYVVHV